MLIDSNIIIYALNPDSVKHNQARVFLQHQKNLVVTQQNIFETLRIVTHPKYPHPLSSNEAVKLIKKMLKLVDIISPTAKTPEVAFQLIQQNRITGLEIFDAYLVATALSNDVRQIATDNTKHLGKYKQIEIINPFQ